MKNTFSTIKSILQLIRVEHSILGAIAGITSVVITARLNQSNILENVGTAFLTAFFGVWVPILIIAGSFALNDVFDLEIDRINQRYDRPLVRGELDPVKVKWVSIFAIILGVILCMYFDIVIFTLTTIFAILAVLYNLTLKEKGLAGNITISACYTCPYILGALIVGIDTQNTLITVTVLSLVAFFGGLGREIYKGIMDVKGDSLRDIKSVARTKGANTAAFLSSGLFAMAILLTPIPLFFGLNNIGYIAFVTIANIMLIYCIVKILAAADKEEVARKGRGLTLIAFIFGTVGFFVGALLL
ncbi:MAG: UbiA family prenyltransferase [Candidatus Hodarchaeota archaeon]